ncbi:MAG: hypothetical protein FWD56_03820 [Bacteroidales bacterium]|nr:hypothetical protein [Bacteroidales bacterium]
MRRNKIPDMKFLNCLLFLLAAVTTACSKDDLPIEEFDGYYLNINEKIFLQRLDDKFYVAFYSSDEDRLREECAKAGITLVSVRKKLDLVRYTKGSPGSGAEKFTNLMAAYIEGYSYEQAAPILSSVLYHSPFYKFKVEGGDEVKITETFTVLMKSKTSLAQLEKLAKKYSVEMIGWDSNEGGYAIGWYHLACTNLAKGNALVMANLFYASGLFGGAWPDMIAGRLL